MTMSPWSVSIVTSRVSPAGSGSGGAVGQLPSAAGDAATGEPGAAGEPGATDSGATDAGATDSAVGGVDAPPRR